MRTISTRTHGYIDYILGIVLIAAPLLFGFEEVGGPAVTIPRIIGALIIGQSLFTDYEMSIAKVIPMRIHLWMDYMASLLLAVSPWLFDFSGFDANVWMPHLIAGVTYFVISMMTKTVPADARHHRVSASMET